MNLEFTDVIHESLDCLRTHVQRVKGITEKLGQLTTILQAEITQHAVNGNTLNGLRETWIEAGESL